jgi:addiction module HigA family antidote
MKSMAEPEHPGKVLQELYINAIPRMSIAKAAQRLNLSRKHVSQLVNGVVRVTPQMALRLGLVFGPSPAFWINLQAQYDIWWADKQPRPKLIRPVTQAELRAG